MKPSTQRAPRVLLTNIKVFDGNGNLRIEYKPNEIAHIELVEGGALEVHFVDWSYITYGPAWKWVVSEKEPK